MEENNNNFRQQLIIVIGLLIISGLVLYGIIEILGGDDEGTQIVLRNAGECPELILNLRAEDDSENITLQARPGEIDRADVQPNVVYSYELTSNNELEGGGCIFSDTPGETNVDRGEVVLPAGSVQEFKIESRRPESNDETEENDS
jgi:hypothetical protein